MTAVKEALQMTVLLVSEVATVNITMIIQLVSRI